MGFFTNWLERMAGLDPAVVNPALPAIGELLADIKTLEPDAKAMEELYFNRIAPTIARMRPKMDEAIKEFDTIAPALQQVLKLFGVQINVGISQPQAVQRINDAIAMAHPHMDMTWIQTSLKRLGYRPGIVDGVYGQATGSAVEAYQKDNHLRVDRWPGPVTCASLIDSLNKRTKT